MLQTHSLGTDTKTTKNSPQYFISTSHNRYQCISRYLHYPARSTIGWFLLLRYLPMNTQLQEEHMTTNLMPGPDGWSTASQLDVKTSSRTASASKNKSSYLEHLPRLSGVGDSLMQDKTHWLKAQSEVPYQMWCRPSHHQEYRIPHKTQTMSLASFYWDSSRSSEMKILRRNKKKPPLFSSQWINKMTCDQNW